MTASFVQDVTTLAAAEGVACARFGDLNRRLEAVTALIVTAGNLLGDSAVPQDKLGEVLEFFCEGLCTATSDARAGLLGRATAGPSAGGVA